MFQLAAKIQVLNFGAIIYYFLDIVTADYAISNLVQLDILSRNMQFALILDNGKKAQPNVPMHPPF